MKILAITCTGARPDAFELCKRFMRRQTRKPDTWLISDDCVPRSEAPDLDFIKYINPPWVWDGKNTVRENLLFALKAAEDIDYDMCVLFEDDDWYAPHYIEWMHDKVEKHGGIVGLCQNCIYHARWRGYRQHCNRRHASGGSTVWAREITPVFIDVLERHVHKIPDRFMWRETTHLPQKLFVTDQHYLSIKGLPGRPGTVGTHRRPNILTFDPELEFLRKYIGDEAELFARFYEPLGSV